jgi:RHS repeat-associated protein
MIFKKHFSMVAAILTGAIAAQAVPCGNNNTGGTTPDCPQSGSDDKPCPDSAAAPGACTSSSISLYTGNERRVVRDLEVRGGVGEHALTWTRYGNSRMSNGISWLGNAHNWRHSYQWEFTATSDASGPSSVVVSYPNGVRFTFNRSADPALFLSVAAATDRLALNAARDTFTLTRDNGWRYVFVVLPNKTWRLSHFLDTQQNTYSLTYDSSNRLAQITEPAGRFLKITYTALPINAQSDTQLASITTAKDGASLPPSEGGAPTGGTQGPSVPPRPPTGLWNTVASSSKVAFRYLRYQGPDKTASRIPELRFRDSQGQILTGTPFSGAVTPVPGAEAAKAFDGDTGSWFVSSVPSGDFVGLDLGTPKTVASIDFYVPPYGGPDLLRGRFLGTNQKPATVTVISKVESSDGRTVTYDYGRLDDPTLPLSWQALTAARYGDGTSASYAYTQAYPSTRPLLATATDPRVVGKGTRLGWLYDKTTPGLVGFAVAETNGVTHAKLIEVSNVGDNLKVTSSNGAVETFAVNHSTGAPKAKTDALGRVSYFNYDANGFGFLTSSRDPMGRTTAYTRTVFGNLLSETYADGASRRWTRDDLDLVLTETDELGRVTTFTRDARRRITRIDYPDQTFETFTYNDFSEVLDHGLRNGASERFTYDARGLRTSHTDALGNLTTFTYSVRGPANPAPSDLLESVTDPLGRATRFEYDERGQLIAQILPGGALREFAYDDFGNRIRSVDELGAVTLTGYDEFKRVVSVTDPLGRSTLYDYSNGPSGSACGSCSMNEKPTAVTLPSGKVTRMTYDLAWQKLSETQGFGTPEAATTAYLYNAAGRVAKITDPLGKATVFQYDRRDRRVSAHDPLGNTTAWTYDAAGNQLTEKRPDNAVTTTAYDAMNRAVSVRDANNQTTALAYDAEGNLVAITDARGSVTRFGYDLRNRRISKTYPDGSAETWGHDAVGNPVLRRTPSGKLATSLYDNRNRLVSTDWSDATPDVAFAYDAAGRVVAATSSASALSYLYNAAGELVSETQEIRAPQAQPARTVGYRYDADGNRAALMYPDGSETTYGYTARNQLATVSAGGPPPLATYGYDLAGNRIRKTLENGTSTAYTYDAAQRLLGVNHTLGTAPLNIAYTLNATGNRTARAESFAGATRREAYGYDAIDQLIETRLNPAGTADERRVGYVYDAAGNRTRVVEDADGTGPGTAQERVYSANALNQYTAISGLAAPLHDIDGNTTLLQSGTRLWSYQYDAQNRLVSGTDGSTTFQFHYDARNRCVSRVINGEVRYLTYDGWSLLEDRDNTGRLTAKHLHGVAVDEVLATVTPAGARYLHQDGLGNVVALTDGSGTVLERVRYDAYGQPEHLTAAGAVSGASPTGNRFLFTGREWFPELGLQDNRHRYYQPSVGRWLSRDPIGENGGLNLYGYVRNDPINHFDPNGECPAVLAIPVVGEVIIVAGVTYVLYEYVPWKKVGQCCTLAWSEAWEQWEPKNRDKKTNKRPKYKGGKEGPPPPPEHPTGKRETDRENQHKEKEQDGGRGGADNKNGDGAGGSGRIREGQR